jgi:hypothetical protein
MSVQLHDTPYYHRTAYDTEQIREHLVLLCHKTIRRRAISSLGLLQNPQDIKRGRGELGIFLRYAGNKN